MTEPFLNESRVARLLDGTNTESVAQPLRTRMGANDVGCSHDSLGSCTDEVNTLRQSVHPPPHRAVRTLIIHIINSGTASGGP